MSTPIRPEHAGWFDDVRRLIKITENTPGLPLPSICGTLAAFNYTGIVHAEDAREEVAHAEMILSYALGADFGPREVPRIGSSAHYVRSAWLPSGLRVDIVAKAGIFDRADIPASREGEPELAAVVGL